MSWTLIVWMHQEQFEGAGILQGCAGGIALSLKQGAEQFSRLCMIWLRCDQATEPFFRLSLLAGLHIGLELLARREDWREGSN